MKVDQWTMVQAKRDFAIGYLTEWRIEAAPMASRSWNVLLRAGTNRGPLVDARTKQARVFKTLDAAVSAITEVGFKVDALYRG